MTRIRSRNLRCSSPAHYSNWRNWRTGANWERASFREEIEVKIRAVKPVRGSEPEAALKPLSRRLYGL
jgi:hypothetical protein